MPNSLKEDTRTLEISVEYASFNIHKEFDRKWQLSLAGIPLSTVNGMLHVLCGERPPSMRPGMEHSKTWENQRIAKIARSGKVKILTNPLPKIETYYGRTVKHVPNKRIYLDEHMALNGPGPEFVKALRSLFPASSMIETMRMFEAVCKTCFSASASPKDRAKAEMIIESLRSQEKELKEKEVKIAAERGIKKPRKVNWKLSGGYLNPFMTKHWAASPDPTGKMKLLGINGTPKRKFTFSCQLYFPVNNIGKPSDSVYLFNKLAKGPMIASFGEGGIARIVPFSLPVDNLPKKAIPADANDLILDSSVNPIQYDGEK